jgi:hypothetical protein
MFSEPFLEELSRFIVQTNLRDALGIDGIASNVPALESNLHI